MKDHSPGELVKNDRDNHLWLDMWRNHQTDFHQERFNKNLTAFWPDLKLLKGSRVFVPLCGKSLDLIWLANQGHEVIGVELSPIAVKKFFRENHLKPRKQRMGNNTLWKHGRISIFCGDYFSLKKSDLGHIDIVYDRAALTALPEDIRKNYALHLQEIVPQADIFLLTVEDIDGEIAHDHISNVDEEINSLFSQAFNINLANVKYVVEVDNKSSENSPMQTEYKVYQLSRKNRYGGLVKC